MGLERCTDSNSTFLQNRFLLNIDDVKMSFKSFNFAGLVLRLGAEEILEQLSIKISDWKQDRE